MLYDATEKTLLQIEGKLQTIASVLNGEEVASEGDARTAMAQSSMRAATEKTLLQIYQEISGIEALLREGGYLGGGSVTPEQIENAVTKYLDNHPVEAYDDTELRESIAAMETAANAEAGKALKAKTVLDGKVTQWEFGEGGGASEDVSQIRENLSVISQKKVSQNLIDASRNTTGYLGTACILKTNAGRITDFIPVEPDTQYTGNFFGLSGGWSSWFFEDANLETKISIIPNLTFVTPGNCHYVRLVYSTNYDDKAMLVPGDTLPSQFVPYENTYDLSDKVYGHISEMVAQKMGDILYLEDNAFFDHGFGRCKITTGSPPTITKTESGTMIGSGYFKITPFVPYLASKFARNFSFLYDRDMQYLGDFYSDDCVTVKEGSNHVFTVVHPEACFAFIAVTSTDYTPETRIQTYSDSQKVATIQEDVAAAIRHAIGGNAPSMHGKKWAILGDSITFGLTLTNANETRFSSLVAKQCGLTDYNYGYSGSRIAVAGDETSDTYTKAMVIRYASMIADADVITVFGGINDANNKIPLGELGSTDIATFYGALDTLCRGLQEKYPGKAIGFITPLRYREDADYAQYVTAIQEVCGKYAIPVLDLYHEGQLSAHTEALQALYFSDGLHPNALGHQVMARKIANFLNRL